MEVFQYIARSLLMPQPCELKPVTGAQLKKKIMSMKQNRAVALDGWRIPELRFLPKSWYELVASCFGAIEQGAPWPETCCLATISTIPKGAVNTQDQNPAATVLAANGLGTRPITNLSPLYTAFSGCRYTDMQEWRESWLSPCMSGSRPKHEIHDCSYLLALKLEYESESGNHTAGVSMDRAKFFDSLEFPLGFFLMELLGAPKGTVQATQRLYQNLKCSYKLRRAASPFFSKGNGFPQGDSWSLQVALAFMNLWTKYMQSDPLQDMPISTGSFLDDSHFYNCNPDAELVVVSLVTAWKRSLQFDHLAGLKTNSNKSFFFANSSILRDSISQALQVLPSDQQLDHSTSFVFLGSVVTSMGVPKKTHRDQKTVDTIEKLRKIRYAPVRFAHRVKMAGAILKSATFGTETVPLTKYLCENLRRAIVQLLWKGKSWCRCWAVTATHIIPVHMLHPQCASFYHMFTLLARLLRRRSDVRALFAQLREHEGSGTGYGPFAVLNQALITFGARWIDTFQFQTSEGGCINLVTDHPEAMKHKLRDCFRSFVLRTNVAFNSRADMAGGPLLAYEHNVALLQYKGKKKQLPLSLFQQSHLRNILTGAVHTQERLFKANCADTPECPWCNSGQVEDQHHLFWQCSRWNAIRDPFWSKYHELFDQLPPCAKMCGLLPLDAIQDWPGSPCPTKFMMELQQTMIQILEMRDSLKPKKRKITLNTENHLPGEPDSPHCDLDEKITLFPNYPWHHDHQDIFHNSCFRGNIPQNWRVYRQGSEWSFGVQMFAPLVWYWSHLKWATSTEDGPSVTWLELALDFNAATHCSICKPGVHQESSPAHQLALFFAQASKRMAVVCKSILFPGCSLTHASILTSLGLGRTIGLAQRPKLMCPQFVHSCLFLTIMQHTERLGRNFKFALVWPPYPTPLWNPSTKKRLIGKQKPPPEVPPASARRNVKAHKQTISGVQWNDEETQHLATAVDWRHRQLLEKILVHNRTSQENNLHQISLVRTNQVFSCTACARQNKNLSKFLKDKCGGAHDVAAQVHFPRHSVLLEKRKKLVIDHNNRRINHHLIVVPASANDPVHCSICHKSDSEAWRRLARFSKAIRPLC